MMIASGSSVEMFDEYKFSYYQTLRTDARKRVVDALNRRIKGPSEREKWKGITLASMNQEALEYARKEWPKFYAYTPATYNGLPVSWERLYFVYMAKLSNFNIAVWQTVGDEKHLQGLALGKPSRGKTHLTINWIERSYAPTYLQGGVLLPILACAEEYAKLLGCECVLIKEPADANEFGKFGYDGYNAALGVAYVKKELDHG
jgi:hypothetical protein